MLFKVVGPRLVSTSPSFVGSSASHPAGPRLPKIGNRAPIDGGGRGRHNSHRVCQTAVTAPPLVGSVVWSQSSAFNSILHTFLHPVLITCPYHLSLPPLTKVVIGSTPNSLLNSSFVLLSFNEIPHIHLMLLSTHSHGPC